MAADRKVQILYTLPSGRRSFRTIWLSQLEAAKRRNEARGITDTRVKRDQRKLPRR